MSKFFYIPTLTDEKFFSNNENRDEGIVWNLGRQFGKFRIFFFLTFIKNFNNYFLKGHFMSNGWKIEATTGL